MVARVSTLQVAPDKLEAVVGQVREESLTKLQESQGFKGFTVLGDSGSGKVIGISFWESEADMEASEQVGDEARQAAAQAGDASGAPTRDAYDVLIDETA
jgi:heme-degrading monooxygenase HmoA